MSKDSFHKAYVAKFYDKWIIITQFLSYFLKNN
jgi:hypothetical protein